MIGIISLTHTKSCEKLTNVIKWAKEKDEHLFDGIDILYSIQGLLAHTTKKGDDSIVLYPFREDEKECVLRFVKKGKSTSQQKLFSVALGIILSFVTITVGRKNILQKYYFNESIH